MNRALQSAAGALIAAVFLCAGSLSAQVSFPHESHSIFFSDCTACHGGIASGDATQSFPDPSFCAACHDGTTAPDISWKRPELRVSSLAFTHEPHTFGCAFCHQPGGEEDLSQLVIPEPETCFGCHQSGTPHQQAGDCGFCHAPVVDFHLTGEGRLPPFHGEGFSTSHGAAAAAGKPDCASCHAENTCVQCHEGQSSPSFHPVNFLASHAPEAFGRTSDCTSCHTSEAFCRECHLGVGLKGGEGLVAPFHDNQGLWILSHPQAARQDLESCVTCHRQNDCLRCHSASAGLRVSPHGPDFNASGLADLNQAMCKVCHGSNP